MREKHWRERGERKGRVEGTGQYAWKRLESISHTVFVDNIPLSMTKSWLWQLFNYEGKVVDVFISHKKRKTSDTPFAFVRFAYLKDAQNAIRNLNGMEIKGCKINATMAEYRRQEGWRVEQARPNGQRYAHERNEANRTGRLYRDVVLQIPKQLTKENDEEERRLTNNKGNENEKNDRTRVVYGVGNQQFMEELGRSAVAETTRPIDEQEVEEIMKATIPSIDKIRQMGAYKILITFNSERQRDEVLRQDEPILREYGADLRNWTMEEVCQTRRTWVECFGVPLHGWCEDNFRRIAEQRGTVVQCDYQITQMSHFNYAKVLIDTCCYSLIQGSVYLSINGCGYDVYVKEVSYARLHFNHEQKILNEEGNDEVARQMIASSGILQAQPMEKGYGKLNGLNHNGERNVNPLFMGGNADDTPQAWEMVETNKCNKEANNLENGICTKRQGIECQENGGSMLSNGSQTIGIEDDRRTEHVMRDLGLIPNGPEDQNLVARAYKEWSKNVEIEDTHRPLDSDPLIPPGFGKGGPISSGETSCTKVPNSIPIEENILHSIDEKPLEEESEGNRVEEQSGDDDEYVEAIEAWRLGRKLGLETEHDGDAIQAIFEERKEWKKGKNNDAKKKKGKRKKRTRKGPGEFKQVK